MTPQDSASGLAEFEVGETFQISDRGAVALAASDRMALLLVHVQQAQVPVGSRIVSLGYTPRASASEPSPFPRPWWQFWK